MNSEQGRVKAFTSQVVNLRLQLKDAGRYEIEYHEGLNDCKKLEDRVKRLEIELKQAKKANSELFTEKETEIVELQFQINQAKMPENEKITELRATIAEKDSLTAEKQARIEKLCENKTDTSHHLAKSLGEKEAELARKNKALNLEQGRVKAFTSQVVNLREQLKDAGRYEMEYHEVLNNCKRLEDHVKWLEIELKEASEALTEAREIRKVKDYSKGQSRRIMKVKQELEVMSTLLTSLSLMN